MSNKIRVLSYKIGETPDVIEIDNNLETLQDFVDGYIQILPISDDLCIICNDYDFVRAKDYKILGSFLVVKTKYNHLVTINEDEVDNIVKTIKEIFLTKSYI